MPLQISSGLKQAKDQDVDTENPDFRINLHISDDQCTLLLDSSGESLHKRGYRTTTVQAPLNEVLAAGMIMLSGLGPPIGLY
jgi:putative N6-adenine-specific DNA methylase